MLRNTGISLVFGGGTGIKCVFCRSRAILSAALLSECFMPRFRFFLMSPLKILLVAGFFFAAAGLIGVPAAEAAKAMLLMGRIQRQDSVLAERRPGG